MITTDSESQHAPASRQSSTADPSLSKKVKHNPGMLWQVFWHNLITQRKEADWMEITELHMNIFFGSSWSCQHSQVKIPWDRSPENAYKAKFSKTVDWIWGDNTVTSYYCSANPTQLVQVSYTRSALPEKFQMWGLVLGTKICIHIICQIIPHADNRAKQWCKGDTSCNPHCSISIPLGSCLSLIGTNQTSTPSTKTVEVGCKFCCRRWARYVWSFECFFQVVEKQLPQFLGK
jgi:hypothetical protein